jgi:hypothetical protein
LPDLDDRFDHENSLNTFFRSDQFPFVLHDIPPSSPIRPVFDSFTSGKTAT